MGYTRPTTITQDLLVSAPLPNHGKTYTVIPHKDVIETTKTLLNTSGFTITKELYRANMIFIVNLVHKLSQLINTIPS